MNKRELKGVLKQPIAFHRIFAEVGGSINAGLFLSQAHYWSDRTNDPDGWFYKTRDEWKRETALTRTEQETARKELRKRKILEEERRGIPAKLYYRVDYDVLSEVIEAFLDRLDAPAPEDDDGEPAPVQLAGILPTSRRESSRQVGRVSAVQLAGKSPTISTENTSESTQRGGHSIKNSKTNGRNGISLEAAAAAAFAQLEPRDQKYVNEQVRMQGRALHEVMFELFNAETARALRGK